MEIFTLLEKYALRPLRQDDAQAIFDAIDSEREYLGRWLPFVAQTHQAEQTRNVVAGMIADRSNPVCAIYDNDSFAGLIGFKSANATTRTIEIGYWLREQHQGKGVMTTAVQTLCKYAFGEMGMTGIEIHCATGNGPSNRIPKHLGFRLDRVEPRAEQLADGTLIDLNIYRLNR